VPPSPLIESWLRAWVTPYVDDKCRWGRLLCMSLSACLSVTRQYCVKTTEPIQICFYRPILCCVKRQFSYPQHKSIYFWDLFSKLCTYNFATTDQPSPCVHYKLPSSVCHWDRSTTGSSIGVGGNGGSIPPVLNLGNNPPHFSGKTACKNYVTWSLITTNE